MNGFGNWSQSSVPGIAKNGNQWTGMRKENF